MQFWRIAIRQLTARNSEHRSGKSRSVSVSDSVLAKLSSQFARRNCESRSAETAKAILAKTNPQRAARNSVYRSGDSRSVSVTDREVANLRSQFASRNWESRSGETPFPVLALREAQLRVRNCVYRSAKTESGLLRILEVAKTATPRPALSRTEQARIADSGRRHSLSIRTTTVRVRNRHFRVPTVALWEVAICPDRELLNRVGHTRSATGAGMSEAGIAGS